MADLAISASAANALEEAIDLKISNAIRNTTSTHTAMVTKVDSDGTTWVHIYGGASETPLRNMTSTAMVGDLISVTISDNAAWGTGNITAPAASTSYVNDMGSRISNENARAVAGIMNGILQINRIIADKASIEELTATEAEVQSLAAAMANIGELVAGEIRTLDLDAKYATINFANVEAANIATEWVVRLFGQSGIFENLVYNEGSVTGVLKAVEIAGDLIKAGTIAADRIIFQGVGEDGEQNGLWYYLNATGAGGLSPEELNLEQYRNALDGSHLVAKSVTANQIDTESLTALEAFVNDLRAQIVQTEHVVVGQQGASHIDVTGDRMSFQTGNGDEAAYIAIDEETGEAMFYVTRAAVVKDLRFGNWKWYDRVNGNLALKWMGGDV